MAVYITFQMTLEYTNFLSFQSPPKYTQICILGLETYHPATLVPVTTTKANYIKPQLCLRINAGEQNCRFIEPLTKAGQLYVHLIEVLVLERTCLSFSCKHFGRKKSLVKSLLISTLD
jgi:hypothetical protein